MAAEITYVPVSGGNTITLNFGTMGTELQDFHTNRETLGANHISVGGKHYAVSLDQYLIADCTFAPLYYSLDPLASQAQAIVTQIAQLHAWIAHAKRGGEFTFAVDENNTWATQLNGAQAQTDGGMQVDDSTGATAGEWCYIEDLNDPTQWECHRIGSVSTGLIGLSSSNGVLFSYADNSPIRYMEYFPACVIEPREQKIITERPGGRGGYLWDIAFSFRTVR